MGKLTNLTDTQILEILDLYNNQKISLSKLQKQFHISTERLKTILTENNVHIRNHRESRFQYPFDENYFDNIDTPDKAYFLGFIYADGFVIKNHDKGRGHNVLGITLAETEPLEKINKYIKCNKPIFSFTQDGFKEGSQKYRLIFPSDHLVESLEKWGCTERKTFTIKFPNFLSDDLIHHFVRGYFDGDGSVFMHAIKSNGKDYRNLGITICGTENFLTELIKAVNLPENCLFREYRRETDCWEIKLNSNIRCLNFYHYLYKDASDLFLTRKREKFENFIKERGSETIIDSLNRENKADYLKLCYLED